MALPLTTPSFIKSSFVWLRSHKALGIVSIFIVAGLCYWSYSFIFPAVTQTKYSLATSARATVISSVSGSGQVSITDQVDVKSKASGEVKSVAVKEGQTVAAGQALAYIDSVNAQKSVRDAQANLQSAKISLSKLKLPADQLSVTQQTNALINASTSLQTAYRTSVNDISSAFLDTPDIMAGLQDVVTGTQTNKFAQWNVDFYKNAIQTYTPRAATYRDEAYNSFITARAKYEAAFAQFKSASLTADDTQQIEKLLKEAYDTTQTFSDATKSIGGFVQFYEDTLKGQSITPSTVADTQLTNIAAYTTKLNSHLTSLLADINTLATSKQKILEAQQSLAKVQRGTEALDIESAQLSVTKAENAVQDARTSLDDYTIRAPFTGVLAKFSISKGDQLSNGATVGTLISGTQIADLSLNEVDAAKVHAGQKVTLTFDAIEGLSIAGVVASVDTLGTVSQGVVSYVVKVKFTTRDDRAKPGMTANANIITDTHLDVLTVPSSAIKSQNNSKYVLAFVPALVTTETVGVTSDVAPQQIPVTIGISDDTNTEILTGLSEGQQVITKTTTNAATKTTTATQSRGGTGAPGIRL